MIPSGNSNPPPNPPDMQRDTNQQAHQQRQKKRRNRQNQSFVEPRNLPVPGRLNTSLIQPNNVPQQQLNATFSHGSQQQKGHYNPNFYNTSVLGASSNMTTNQLPHVPNPTGLAPPMVLPGFPMMLPAQQGVPIMVPTYQGAQGNIGVPMPQYPVPPVPQGYSLCPGGPVFYPPAPMQQGQMAPMMTFDSGYQNLVPQAMGQVPPPVQAPSAPQQQRPSVPMPHDVPPIQSSSSQPTSTDKPFPHGMLDAPVFVPKKQNEDEEMERLRKRIQELEEEVNILRDRKPPNSTHPSNDSERKAPAENASVIEAIGAPIEYQGVAETTSSAPEIRQPQILHPMCDLEKRAAKLSKVQIEKAIVPEEIARKTQVSEEVKAPESSRSDVRRDPPISSIKKDSARDGNSGDDTSALSKSQAQMIYPMCDNTKPVSDRKTAVEFSKSQTKKSVVPKQVVTKTRVPDELKSSKDPSSSTHDDSIEFSVKPTSSSISPQVDLSRLSLEPSESIACSSSSGIPFSNDAEFPFLNETLRESEPFTAPKKKNTAKLMPTPATQYKSLKKLPVKDVGNVKKEKENKDETFNTTTDTHPLDTSTSTNDISMDVSLDSSNPNSQKQKQQKEKRRKAKKSTKKEETVQEPLEEITPGRFTEYIVAVRNLRSTYLSFQKQRQKVHPFQDAILDFLKENGMNIDSKKNWDYCQDIIRRRIYAYQKTVEEDTHKMVTFLYMLYYEQSDVTIIDILYLYMKDTKELFLQEKERQYYLMVEKVAEWKPQLDRLAVVSIEDLPANSDDVSEKYKNFFVEYIRNHRDWRSGIEPDEHVIRLIEATVIYKYSIFGSFFIGWKPQNSIEFIQQRLAKLAGKEDSELIQIYKSFYNFLLNVRSSVVDFDLYWVNGELEAKRMPSKNLEPYLFQLLFGFKK